MWRAERRGEVNDSPPPIGSDAPDDVRERRHWRGPDEENRIDVIERGVHRFGTRQVTLNDVDESRQRRALRPARERPNLAFRRAKLVDDEPTNTTRRTDHKGSHPSIP